ncbi:MAG: MucB/RseB C-terminal domain-containing protein [Pontibacterium sp.]
MTDQSMESVSALMDGEVTDFELKRSLQKYAEDPEASQRWRRYHLASTAMREALPVSTQVDISDRIRLALDEEPPLKAETEKPLSADTKSEAGDLFWKPLTSMAVAASVTAMVIFGSQNFGQSPVPVTGVNTTAAYGVPASVDTGNYVRAQLGSRVSLPDQNASTDSKIIRLSGGLAHYVSQHQHFMSKQEAAWQADWLPEGFSALRHEILPAAEVMVFSDGRSSFTISIEKLGQQSMPQGVAQADKVVAVAKRMNNHFVTVVGDVPLMLAERIAAAVSPKRL